MATQTASAPKIMFKIQPLVDLADQSSERELLQISFEGQQKEERSRGSKVGGEGGQLSRSLFDDVTTLYEGFHRGLAQSSNGDCLGYRSGFQWSSSQSQTDAGVGPYRWISYGTVIRRSENVARGFIEKGLQPGQSTLVGLYSQNRPEWVFAEQACYFYSMVVVPLYDTLGPDACSFIISQAEIQLVLVDKSKKAESLLKKHQQCPTLRVLVLLEPAEPSLQSLADQCGVEIVPFEELEKLGEKAIDRAPPATPPKPDDLSTISYTSGTTGLPKGAMLTHGNIVADCSGALAVLKYSMFNSSDVTISYLPLAHMFERIMQSCIYMVGGKVGFSRGDMKLLMDDIKELRPTIIPVVPRVLNRTYDKVMQATRKNVVKSFLLDLAIKSKKKDLENMIVRNTSVWDKLVFKKLREGMGGRVRLMITGSAPLSAGVLTFMRSAMGCIILEGYGQTECVGACTLTLEGDNNPGHVGPPIPCCKLKVVDVPEMNYFAKDGVGEVCVKGYNVFKGYYKDPEKTAEALDEEGWLHTGDIGRWTPEGTIKIVDRKKNIFKLAQGEYIAPEKIENVYVRSQFVNQIFVHGESLKSCLVAIVSPDADALLPYAEKEMGIKATVEDLCKNESIKKLIMDDLIAEGKKASLHSFEQVKDIYLHPEPFTIEAGLLTPTMKSKRPAMKEYFNQQIAQMYRELD